MEKQSRKCQLTINNPLPEYTHEKIKEICALQFQSFQYGAISDEIGEHGTYHTHIYLVFRNSVRFSTLKKHFPTAHIELAKGSVKQNLDYLKKSGKWEKSKKAETSVQGSFEEFGECPTNNRGKRFDLSELYHMIVDEGLSNAEIIEINQDYILEIDKLDKIRNTFLYEKFRGTRRLNLETIYVCGATGVGKSRSIMDFEGDENVYRVTDYTHPFDSYCTENVLVFEEFRSSLSIGDMLNYLDIYPVQLKARYNNKQACYLKVYICTNWELEMQYSEIQKVDQVSWQAFLRRIHKVRYYTEKGKYIEYSSVKDYLARNQTFKPISELPKEEQQRLPFTDK